MKLKNKCQDVFNFFQDYLGCTLYGIKINKDKTILITDKEKTIKTKNLLKEFYRIVNDYGMDCSGIYLYYLWKPDMVRKIIEGKVKEIVEKLKNIGLKIDKYKIDIFYDRVFVYVFKDVGLNMNIIVYDEVYINNKEYDVMFDFEFE